MKLHSECIACQVQVRFKDLQRVITDESKRFSLMIKVLNLLMKEVEERGRDITPTHLGTKLFRFIKIVTGISDPYEDEKRRECINGLKLYNVLNKELKSLDIMSRVVKCIKLALIGNALDLGVAGYIPPNTQYILKESEVIKIRECDIELILKMFKKARIISFILDNTGEAVFDKLLSESVRNLKTYTIAIVKSGAFQNDITIKEAEYLELSSSFDEVLETGTDAASIFLEELTPRVKRAINESDVLISKGMANFEYLSEVDEVINKPIIYMLKAKCIPVAKELGVNVGDYVLRTKIKS